MALWVKIFQLGILLGSYITKEKTNYQKCYLGEIQNIVIMSTIYFCTIGLLMRIKDAILGGGELSNDISSASEAFIRNTLYTLKLFKYPLSLHILLYYYLHSFFHMQFKMASKNTTK